MLAAVTADRHAGESVDEFAELEYVERKVPCAAGRAEDDGPGRGGGFEVHRPCRRHIRIECYGIGSNGDCAAAGKDLSVRVGVERARSCIEADVTGAIGRDILIHIDIASRTDLDIAVAGRADAIDAPDTVDGECITFVNENSAVGSARAGRKDADVG